MVEPITSTKGSGFEATVLEDKEMSVLVGSGVNISFCYH